MSQMLKSSGAMSVATMTSRVLGLVREIAYAALMGTTWVADAFNLAFAVPNLFRRLLGEGALTAAFIPIFKQKEKIEGEKEMWRAANAVISALIIGASLIIVAGVIGISLVLPLGMADGRGMIFSTPLALVFPWMLGMSVAGLIAWTVPSVNAALGRASVVVKGAAFFATFVFGAALAGGVLLMARGNGAGRTLLMLELLRVMFPYLLLVCLAAVFMGMLNARGHFFIPAMGATMLNIVMISSVLLVVWLAPKYGWRIDQQVFGLAIGVVIAGVAQAAFQLPLLRREGFHYEWVRPFGDETVRRVVVQMLPGSIGVAAFQINVLLTQGLAFWVEPGVLTSFSVAVRLMELPQGVFGISLATTLLPLLSGLAAEKKYPEFRTTLGQGMNWLVFVNLLASVLLVALAEPMIRLLFERGKFDVESTARSALALTFLAPGLVAFSMVNILARAFYALGDIRTPMRISIFCLVLNLVFVGCLVWRFKQGGLGAANTMSALINVSLLFYALRKKLKTLELSALRQHLLALLGAAVVAGVTAWGAAAWWSRAFGHGTFFLKLGEVFVPMALASLVYFGITIVCKTGHLGEVTAMLRARRGRAG